MAIRSVVQVGDDVLRQKCFPVENFDESLYKLLDDMKDTVKKEKGAGLAGPQIGVLRRVVVVDVDEGYFEYSPNETTSSSSQVISPIGFIQSVSKKTR